MAKKKYTALVLYYSNTQNTAKLAKQAVQTLRKAGWSVNQLSLAKAHKGLPIKKPDLVVLGTPVHFWQVPVPAIKMIRRLPRFDGAKAFIFTTYGTVFDGDAPYQLSKEAGRLGAWVLGGASVLAPHNFMGFGKKRIGDKYKVFGKGQPDKLTMQNFRGALKVVAERVQEDFSKFDIKKMRSPKPVLTFLEGLPPVSMQRDFLPKIKWDSQLCTQCGKCVRACPTNSISLINGEIITDHTTCYRCYQCLWTCDSDARSASLTAPAVMLYGLKKMIKNPGTRMFL